MPDYTSLTRNRLNMLSSMCGTEFIRPHLAASWRWWRDKRRACVAVPRRTGRSPRWGRAGWWGPRCCAGPSAFPCWATGSGGFASWCGPAGPSPWWRPAGWEQRSGRSRPPRPRRRRCRCAANSYQKMQKINFWKKGACLLLLISQVHETYNLSDVPSKFFPWLTRP